MSFYSSVMADQPTKKTIVEVIGDFVCLFIAADSLLSFMQIMQHALKIPRVGSSLVRNQGLQAWIYQILALSRDEEEKHTWDNLLQQVNCVDID